MPTFQALKAFRSIMEVGSLTGAAEQIGRTKPQVSRLLAQLEKDLGFDLFSRDKNRLIPTRKAHLFYKDVLQTLESLDQLKVCGDVLRKEHQIYIRAITPPCVGHTIMPEVIERFRSAYPDSRLSLEFSSSATLGTFIATQRFDFGVAELPFDAPSVKITRLGAVGSAIALPKGHPLERKEIVRLADLRPYPIVALNRKISSRRKLDELFAAEDLEPNVCAEADNGFTACTLVAREVGVAVLNDVWRDVIPKGLVSWRPWLPGHQSEFAIFEPKHASDYEPVKFVGAVVREIFERDFSAPLAKSDGAVRLRLTERSPAAV